MLKNILALVFIISQFIWNAPDSLERESWLHTEKQSKKDIGKESSKKEKEINLSSFARHEARENNSLPYNLHQATIFNTGFYSGEGNPLLFSYTKVPLYLLQSCIRI